MLWEDASEPGRERDIRISKRNWYHFPVSKTFPCPPGSLEVVIAGSSKQRVLGGRTMLKIRGMHHLMVYKSESGGAPVRAKAHRGMWIQQSMIPLGQ